MTKLRAAQQPRAAHFERLSYWRTLITQASPLRNRSQVFFPCPVCTKRNCRVKRNQIVFSIPSSLACNASGDYRSELFALLSSFSNPYSLASERLQTVHM